MPVPRAIPAWSSPTARARVLRWARRPTSSSSSWGAQSLRGFYPWRFTGNTLVYNNLELCPKLLDFTSYLLPDTLGLVAFNDVGRVWPPGETSVKWHDGYGDGRYFLPAQLLLVQAVVGFSNEGTYPHVSAGFRV